MSNEQARLPALNKSRFFNRAPFIQRRSRRNLDQYTHPETTQHSTQSINRRFIANAPIPSEPDYHSKSPWNS